MSDPEFLTYHNRDIRWFDAPLPRRLHRCKPWTVAYIDPPHDIQVHRCACGSFRSGAPLLGFSPWVDRNSRRHGPTLATGGIIRQGRGFGRVSAWIDKHGRA